jgi:hypothetical protein
VGIQGPSAFLAVLNGKKRNIKIYWRYTGEKEIDCRERV